VAYLKKKNRCGLSQKNGIAVANRDRGLACSSALSAPPPPRPPQPPAGKSAAAPGSSAASLPPKRPTAAALQLPPLPRHRSEPVVLPRCRASQIASPRCVPPCRTTGEPPPTSHNSGASPSRSQSSPVAHPEGPVLTHGRPLELWRARFTGERRRGRRLTACIGRSRRWRRPRPYTFLGATVSPGKKSLSRDAA
jgi:hypothetical protein